MADTKKHAQYRATSPTFMGDVLRIQGGILTVRRVNHTLIVIYRGHASVNLPLSTLSSVNSFQIVSQNRRSGGLPAGVLYFFAPII